METSLIEKFDKSRYDLMKWLTFGWVIWFGTVIVKDYISNKPLIMGLMFTGLIGWLFFTINLVRCVGLGKKINADVDLKAALSNEMHQFYMHKSFVWGFWVSILTAGSFVFVTAFMEVSALLTCELILFAGVTAALLSHLIYNRE